MLAINIYDELKESEQRLREIEESNRRVKTLVSEKSKTSEQVIKEAIRNVLKL